MTELRDTLTTLREFCILDRVTALMTNEHGVTLQLNPVFAPPVRKLPGEDKDDDDPTFDAS